MRLLDSGKQQQNKQRISSQNKHTKGLKDTDAFHQKVFCLSQTIQLIYSGFISDKLPAVFSYQRDDDTFRRTICHWKRRVGYLQPAINARSESFYIINTNKHTQALLAINISKQTFSHRQLHKLESPSVGFYHNWNFMGHNYREKERETLHT